ncbi:hypothetical protein ACFYO5_31700 [Streptomyces sp. NPDC006259]|uniref:hypothetical protein n=1 Tax=Streptomyces sp. NPDC006259 TaxID=3364740 RepID=UPI00367C29D9
MSKSTKIVALITALLALTTGVWFSYREVFTRGLDHLPSKVCDEAVKRETVMRTLPDARSAEEGSDTIGAGYGFMFTCHINTTSESLLSGESEIQDSSQKSWEKYYKSYGGESKGKTEQTAEGGVYALSRGDFASVYVPCVPRGSKAVDASQAPALITEVRVIGESRATGPALHQALVDFAYEMTRHAYALGKCQNAHKFPDELPRFGKS